MITDKQVRKLRRFIQQEKTLDQAAAKCHFSPSFPRLEAGFSRPFPTRFSGSFPTP